MTQVAEVLADRYEVGAHLGSGGMGDVYRARDRMLDRPVAVKVPSSLYASISAERFQREARAAARLNHPNIVTVYDWGEDPDPFIVMELVDGHSLRVMLSERGPLPPVEVAVIGAEIADALAHAHQHGVVHRDVKPSNVLVSGSGKVKVTDFGIARSDIGEALTEPGLVLGTTGYLSPEQAAGQPGDARSDIYSLGIVLAELLSGERRGADTQPVTELERIVARARAVDPSSRYQRAADLRDELRRSIGSAPPIETTAVAPTLAPVAKRRRVWRLRHYTLVLAAPLLLLVGAAVGYTKLTEHAPIVAVPDVVNRDVFTAVAMMKQAQFEVQAVAADSPQPGGVILSQRPPNGQKLEQGSVVHLTVSRTSATVPDVVSLDEAAARSLLARRGLANLAVTADYRDDVDAGIVVGTSPAAFVQVAKTDPIRLVVARDPHVTLPNVVGLDQATATDQLQALGVQVVIETASSKGVVAGRVSKMSPTAKEVVVRGDVVTLTVSTGSGRRKS